MNKSLLVVSKVGIFLVIIDQILKNSVGSHVSNPGFFLGLQMPETVLILLHLIIVIAGIYWILNKKPTFGHWYLLLLIVSLSNLIDRIIRGAVVDYLNFVGIWFNLSDAIITAVLIILIVQYLKETYAGIRSNRK